MEEPVYCSTVQLNNESVCVLARTGMRQDCDWCRHTERSVSKPKGHL